MIFENRTEPFAMRVFLRQFVGLFLLVALALTLSGGCVFAPAGKRGNIEDELDVEREHALRALDGADAAGALPALAELAENAGRMDEVALRIQSILLIAKTLDAEAGLWPPERAEKIREASRKQAALALREATDLRRFGAGSAAANREAVLLEYDAKILSARLNGADEGEMEALLRAAQQEATARGGLSRAVAWRLALSQMEARRGDAAAAGRWYGMAEATYEAERKKPGSGASGASESLDLAFAEARGDMALYARDAFGALGEYERALGLARKLRRRADIYRMLGKLIEASESGGDAERAAWYSRRAKAVSRQSAASAGDRVIERETGGVKKDAQDSGT